MDKNEVAKPTFITVPQYKQRFPQQHVYKILRNGHVSNNLVSEICLAKRLHDNKSVVAKITRIDKSRVLWVGCHLMPVEGSLLKILRDDPGVVTMVDQVQTDRFYITITELAPTTINLYDFIGLRDHLSEGLTRHILRQVVNTLLRLQQHYNIIHGDINDKNIIVHLDTLKVQLLDFGGSHIQSPGRRIKIYGDPLFCPPEWVATAEATPDGYTVWAIGVLLYIMLYGVQPFQSSKEIVEKKCTSLRPISILCSNLLVSCWEDREWRRSTLQDLACHEWFKCHDNMSVLQSEVSSMPEERPITNVLE